MRHERREKVARRLTLPGLLVATIVCLLGCGRAVDPVAPPQAALESTPAVAEVPADSEVVVYEASVPPVHESQAPADVLPFEPEPPVSELRDSDDPLVGTWIGKWDGMYTVMILIRKDEDLYDVVYKWEEQLGYPFRSVDHQKFPKAKENELSFGRVTITLGEQDGHATAVGDFEQVTRRAPLIRIDEMNERILTIAYVQSQWQRLLPEMQPDTAEDYVTIAGHIKDLAQAVEFIDRGVERFPQSLELLRFAIGRNIARAEELLKIRSDKNMEAAGVLVRRAAGQARTLLGEEIPLTPFTRNYIENALYELARMHANAGNAEQAYSFLGDLADIEFADGARLKLEPDFASLRDDPKFTTLIQTMRPRPEPIPGQDYELQQHPGDAVEFQGHWYKVVPEKLNWKQAQTRCREMGGYIACIESAEEDEFLDRQWPQGHLWLGARLDANGKWVWLTGKPIAHANWEPGEPNNLALGTMLRIKTGPGGFWFDVPLDDGNMLGFVCEWER